MAKNTVFGSLRFTYPVVILSGIETDNCFIEMLTSKLEICICQQTVFPFWNELASSADCDDL